MISFFTFIGAALLLQMILVFSRIIKGPSVIDRIVAVNIIGTKAAVLLVFAGIIFDQLAMFIDVSITYAFLNFIASIAASKYIKHTKQLDLDSQQEVGQ